MMTHVAYDSQQVRSYFWQVPNTAIVVITGRSRVPMTDDEPTSPLRTFGEELRAQRKRAGMSQAEVGAKLLISQSLETDATRIHAWEMRYVPGLLQTPDYARAVIKAGTPREADDVIDRDVTVRMARQEIFVRNDAPFLWFVLDESVLYRAHGNNKNLMREQVEKLINLAE